MNTPESSRLIPYNNINWVVPTSISTLSTNGIKLIEAKQGLTNFYCFGWLYTTAKASRNKQKSRLSQEFVQKKGGRDARVAERAIPRVFINTRASKRTRQPLSRYLHYIQKWLRYV